MSLEWLLAPSWTFTQGVVLGQASMIILAFLFLKYVVFEDASVAKEAALAKAAARRTKRAPSLVAPHTLGPDLLSTLSYDLPTHAPESADWLNVLLAQTLSAYRTLINSSTEGEGGAKGLMESILNRKSSPDQTEDPAPSGLMGIDWIEVDEVEVGDKFPILSNARVRPSGEGEGVRIELDLDLHDHINLSLSTRLLVNFPRPKFAILPVSLSLTLTRFSGTVSLTLPPPNTSAHPSSNPSLHLSLHPDFTMNLETSSLLGARAKLQDVPKVEQLLGARIRGWITDKVVWPGRVEVSLPGVGRKHPKEQGAHHPAGPSSGDEWTLVSEPGSPSSTKQTFTSEGDSGEGEQGDDEVEGARPPSLFFPDADNVPHPIPAHLTSDSPNPDSGAPSVDLDADGGPSVLLRPKLRTRAVPPSLGPGSGANPFTGGGIGGLARGFGGMQPAGPASPTESLPGYYRSVSYSRAAAGGTPGKRYAGMDGSAGLRYRNGSGVGIAP